MDGKAQMGTGPERGSTPRLSTMQRAVRLSVPAHLRSRVSSVGERPPVEREVAGSSPARGATDTTYEIGF